MRLVWAVLLAPFLAGCNEDGLSTYIAKTYPKFSEVRPGSALYVPGRFGVVDLVKPASSGRAAVVALSRVCRVNVPVPEEPIVLSTYKYDSAAGVTVTADILSQIEVSGAKAIDIVDHVDVTPTKAAIVSLADPDIKAATEQAFKGGCGYTVKNGEMITGAIKATLTADVKFKAGTALDVATKQQIAEAIAGKIGLSASTGSETSLSGEDVYIAVRTEKIDPRTLE